MVLKRKDMQIGVNQKFLDQAISVREAAVDLIGKYVLNSEELIDQYYDIISQRILVGFTCWCPHFFFFLQFSHHISLRIRVYRFESESLKY